MLGKYAPNNKPPTKEGTVLSICHQFTCAVTREDAEEKLRSIFKKLSPKAMVDHVILGHFKGAIRYGGAVFSVSVTREAVLDETSNDAWKDLTILLEGEVTVNLLSVIPVSITEQELKNTIQIFF